MFKIYFCHNMELNYWTDRCSWVVSTQNKPINSRALLPSQHKVWNLIFMKIYPSFPHLSALECTNCGGRGCSSLPQILIWEMLSSLWYCIYMTVTAALSHWTLWEASVFCVCLRGWCVSVLSKSCHLCEDKTHFKSSISSTQRIVQKHQNIADRT